MPLSQVGALEATHSFCFVFRVFNWTKNEVSVHTTYYIDALWVMLSKSRHLEKDTVWFYLYKMCTSGKFIDIENILKKQGMIDKGFTILKWCKQPRSIQ